MLLQLCNQRISCARLKLSLNGKCFSVLDNFALMEAQVCSTTSCKVSGSAALVEYSMMIPIRTVRRFFHESSEY